jgi:hypothetical protein
MTGWWPGDKDASSLVAGGPTGTLIGNVTFGQAEVGKGFVFDGKSRVEFGTSPAIVGTGPFAVDAWVQTTVGGTIIAQRDQNGFDGEYELTITQAGQVNWWTFGDGQVGFDLTSTAKVDDGRFHLVVATREVDGSGRIYIDGKLDSTQSSPPRTLAALTVAIGADARNAATPLTGVIDEVEIFNRALTATDVTSLYQAGSAGKCAARTPSCVGTSCGAGAYAVETTPPNAAATWTWTGSGFSFETPQTSTGMSLMGRTGDTGAATGVSQSGNDFSFLYVNPVTNYVVQADAIIPADRFDISSLPSAGASIYTHNSLSVFFRRPNTSSAACPAHPCAEIGLFNGTTETDTGCHTGITDQNWHNFAVNFNQCANHVLMYVDSALVCDEDLTTFAGGAYMSYSNAAVGMGGNSAPTWMDNFLAGPSK